MADFFFFLGGGAFFIVGGGEMTFKLEGIFQSLEPNTKQLNAA